MEVEYFLSDHLGSTSLTTDSNGVKVSEIKYKPWGEIRSAWYNPDLNDETKPDKKTTPMYALTRQTFTGQYSYMDDPSTAGVEGFGLMFYNARWMDPQLGRFTQPDTIIPGENISQSWDRYAYVGNNPIKNTDPDGHCYPLCTMAIGAALGAMVTAGVYTYYNHGQDFNYNEFALAVGAGIVAGGIVGTGVGLVLAPKAAEAVSAASADGDPTNEIKVAAEIVDDVAQKASSAGDAINTGTNTVYKLVEKGVTKYVGITNDFTRRAGEHLENRDWQIERIPGLGNLSRFDARAVEQSLIEQVGLPNLYNKINSIASSNPIYSQAIQRGEEILEAIR